MAYVFPLATNWTIELNSSLAVDLGFINWPKL